MSRASANTGQQPQASSLPQKATYGMNLDLRRKMQMASRGPVEHTDSEVRVEPNPALSI